MNEILFLAWLYGGAVVVAGITGVVAFIRGIRAVEQPRGHPIAKQGYRKRTVCRQVTRDGETVWIIEEVRQ